MQFINVDKDLYRFLRCRSCWTKAVELELICAAGLTNDWKFHQHFSSAVLLSLFLTYKVRVVPIIHQIEYIILLSDKQIKYELELDNPFNYAVLSDMDGIWKMDSVDL